MRDVRNGLTCPIRSTRNVTYAGNNTDVPPIEWREWRVEVTMKDFLLIPALAIGGLILFLPQIVVAFVALLLVANAVVAIWIRLDDRRLARDEAEFAEWKARLDEEEKAAGYDFVQADGDLHHL